jgi:hypothetical protein
MTERHWSEDDLLNHLYGVGPDDGHPDLCAECRVRLERLRQRRLEMTAEPEFSVEEMAAQRRRIYGRLGDPPRRRVPGWPPAIATAALLVVAVVLSRPAPVAEVKLASSGESQFYTEIYQSMGSVEPRAAEPIHGLFDGQ